jgi:hypothetical protein
VRYRRFSGSAQAERAPGERIGRGRAAANQMSLPVGRQMTETDKPRGSDGSNGSVVALVTRSMTFGRESDLSVWAEFLCLDGTSNG